MSNKGAEALQNLANGLIKAGSRSWTPEKIQNVNITDLAALVTLLDTDDPALSLQVIPKGMSIPDFDRMVNREISRRNMWGYVYDTLTRVGARRDVAGVEVREPDELRQAFDFVRPKFSFPAGVSTERTQLRLDPSVVAIYDSSIDTLVSNESGFGYRADAARAAGLPKRPDGKGYGYVSNTDVADKRLLYALGAQAAFNPSNPNAQTTVSASTPQTLDQIQATYCSLAETMYQEGRSIQPRDAGLTGFIEARIDARNGFNVNGANGITAACPAPRRAANGR